MSDKNPKHPLKKKKAAAKINIADHAAVEEAREAHKSKKHSILITGYKVDERCPESQDPGYFDYGKLKVSFFTN